MARLDNPRHERFCHEMLIDGNATQAAIRAGYSPRSATSWGSQLLADLNISKRLAELREEKCRQLGIDASGIILMAMEVYSRCMQAVPVLSEGEPTGEWRFDSSGANKALDTIGKVAGVFMENRKITADIKEQLTGDFTLKITGHGDD